MIDGQEVRVWICLAQNKTSGLSCGHRQTEQPGFYRTKILPHILYIDIERSLGEFYAYDRKVPSGYMSIEMLKTEPFIICYAAGWVTKSGDFQYIFSDCVRQDEALRRDDSRVMESLWRLMNDADYIVGHNVRRFDDKKVNERFISLGMTAPTEYKTIDTYVWSKAKFDFMSNGLNYIAPKLGGTPKQEVTRDDWIEVVETGNRDTLMKVEEYCRGDVREGIHVFRREWDYIESSGKQVFK